MRFSALSLSRTKKGRKKTRPPSLRFVELRKGKCAAPPACRPKSASGGRRLVAHAPLWCQTFFAYYPLQRMILTSQLKNPSTELTTIHPVTPPVISITSTFGFIFSVSS